jgi:hypothetical protein
MEQGAVDGKAIPEQVDFPTADHAADGEVAVIGLPRKDARYAVADKNGGLMAKLREAFFNYLRNRAL